MTVENSRVAAIFDEVAGLLEISGAGFFRVRAYRNAARMIRDMSTPIAEFAAGEGGKLEDLPGIGSDLAARIRTIATTGDLPLRIELEEQVPPGLLEVTGIAGIGPRKAHALFLELGVKDLESLREAAASGKVRLVKGFGPRTEENILEGIYAVKGRGGRMLRPEAETLFDSVKRHLDSMRGIKTVVAAGSYRRLAETVGDLDILVVCEDAREFAARFVELPGVTRVIAGGPTRVSVVAGDNRQVDTRVIEEDSLGAALHYFTGSRAHSVALRRMALRRGMKLNEYGLFEGDRRVAGSTEGEVYAALGLPFIPPELRENRGEIGAALEGRLPDPVDLPDIRGDLHVHTDLAEGRDTAAAVLAEAKRRGYLYIAVANHARRAPAGPGGLDGRRLLEHWEEMARLDRETPGIHALKGVEVDILEDGSLSIEDEVLAGADFVIASVHDGRNLTRPQMTRRVVRAMENPLVDAIGHPMGRRLNERPPWNIDMDDVIAAAARTGTALELNSNPGRLDLDDRHCRAAKEHGVKVLITTDAHGVDDMEFMRYGVGQARRGWLEAGDVLNTLTWRSLMARHRRVRRAGAVFY